MIPNLAGHKRILVAPLHWGLGHATRCIPIIDHLLSIGKEVAIAGDSESFELLQRKYPDLEAFALPSYNIRYSSSITMSMVLQGPKLLHTYRKELKASQQIVDQWTPDVIISDNRFGVRNKNTHNIYLTHQLNIQHDNKYIAHIANLLHRKYIHQYDECWVPDFIDRKLSGKLSDDRGIKIPCTYIGGLTRINLELVEPVSDLLIILSGPEPARTSLEKSLVEQSKKYQYRINLVRGTNKKRLENYPEHIEVLDIVDQDQLTSLINESAAIVCRSGYSTIMDLQDYNRPIYYIPTKGQTEQEYLAEYHSRKRNIESTQEGSDVMEMVFGD